MVFNATINNNSVTERYPEPFSFSKGIFGMLYLYLLDIRSYRVHNAAETSTKESFNNNSVISWRSVLLIGGNRRKPPTCRKSLTNFVT
jgi:hypothetical protein